MLFRVNGRVYTETPVGAHPYMEVEARMDNGEKFLSIAAGGIDTLPADAYPMTYEECIRGMEPTEDKPVKTRRKGGEKSVSGLQ